MTHSTTATRSSERERDYSHNDETRRHVSDPARGRGRRGRWASAFRRRVRLKRGLILSETLETQARLAGAETVGGRRLNDWHVSVSQHGKKKQKHKGGFGPFGLHIGLSVLDIPGVIRLNFLSG